MRLTPLEIPEVLLVEPTGTLSVGDEHDEVPEHVTVTTGQPHVTTR